MDVYSSSLHHHHAYNKLLNEVIIKSIIYEALVKDKLLLRLAPGDWENPNPSDLSPEELENIWDLKNSSWLILGSTMSQGSDILPKYVEYVRSIFYIPLYFFSEGYHLD